MTCVRLIIAHPAGGERGGEERGQDQYSVGAAKRHHVTPVPGRGEEKFPKEIGGRKRRWRDLRNPNSEKGRIPEIRQNKSPVKTSIREK